MDFRTKPWTPKRAAPHLILENAAIVDAETGSVQRDMTVELKDGLISSINHASELMPVDADAQHIDLAGKYLCPGLIDCHVHVCTVPGNPQIKDMFAAHPNTLAYRTTYVVKQMLLRGFTTARDCGGADAALKHAIDEHLVPGPRLFIAGKALSQTGGHGDARQAYEEETPECCGGSHASLGRLCDGVPACLHAARDELRKGSDFIKIMGGGGVASPADPLEMVQFSAEEIRAICGAAANIGTYVTAHAYSVASIRHCVENGVRGIEHANFIDSETAALCRRKGVFVTPTLVTYQAMTTPPFDKFLPASGREKNKQVLASGLDALKICQEAGVTVCFGTDLLAGMHPFQNGEFSIRAKALSNQDILKSATVNAAKRLRMEGKLGVVKEGALGDLLVLEKNPLEDVTILDDIDEHCVSIIKEGRVVKSKLEQLRVDDVYAVL